MSFYLPATKIEQSTEMNVAPQSVFTAEGQVVARAKGNTANGVFPSTGQATDLFCGFAFAGTSAAPFPEPTYNKVETFLVPATGKVKLSLAPISNTEYFAFDVTANAPATGTTLAVDSITGLTPGNTVTVTYKYALTAVQRRVLFGDVQPGGYIGDYIGQIGVITRGTVFTSQFDASQNWQAAGSDAAHTILMGAGGQVTMGDPAATTPAGTPIPGAYVLSVPGSDIPFLGLSFDAH
ncbi:hypothetical protein BcepSauron_083 [Burkholderia phage BcepSauron]|uniref:Uncharacterized protein n=1 Tax=Burkholderia phage BcepSauron TaxID=2530033 RepID=A0A482MMS9_9CAUD|nr:virion structural protein [Burkholderia phage BcepSauron]QBQ74463.1 hypothetical protein BcepSauron_083 [Burkholderia phage BcepSauron]